MSADTRISPVPLAAGTLLFTGAVALLCEDGLHGHWHLNHALQPLLMAGTIVAGVMAHHRLVSLRPSGLAFLALALLGSSAVIYATLSRTASARDLQAADAMAINRTLAEKAEALKSAKLSAAVECRKMGPLCEKWNARVDQLTREMAPLRAVAVDPRADALGRLAELFGQDGKRVRAIVAAVDPVILPLFLEAGCILFIAAAFPNRRNPMQPSPVARNSEETVTVAPRVYTQAEALCHFRAMREANAQQFLAQQWGVDKSTVSRWLKQWQEQGLAHRQRDGRSKLALASPSRLTHPIRWLNS